MLTATYSNPSMADPMALAAPSMFGDLREGEGAIAAIAIGGGVLVLAAIVVGTIFYFKVASGAKDVAEKWIEAKYRK